MDPTENYGIQSNMRSDAPEFIPKSIQQQQQQRPVYSMINGNLQPGFHNQQPTYPNHQQQPRIVSEFYQQPMAINSNNQRETCTSNYYPPPVPPPNSNQGYVQMFAPPQPMGQPAAYDGYGYGAYQPVDEVYQYHQPVGGAYQYQANQQQPPHYNYPNQHVGGAPQKCSNFSSQYVHEQLNYGTSNASGFSQFPIMMAPPSTYGRNQQLYPQPKTSNQDQEKIYPQPKTSNQEQETNNQEQDEEIRALGLVVIEKNDIVKFQWSSGARCNTIIDGELQKVKIAMLHASTPPSATLATFNAKTINRDVQYLYPLRHFCNESEGTKNIGLEWEVGDICIVETEAAGKRRGWIQSFTTKREYARIFFEGEAYVTEPHKLENVYPPHMADPQWRQWVHKWNDMRGGPSEAGPWTEVPHTAGGLLVTQFARKLSPARRRAPNYFLKACVCFTEAEDDGMGIVHNREVLVSCLPDKLQSLSKLFGPTFPQIISHPRFRSREPNLFDDVMNVPCGSSRCDGKGDECRCGDEQMVEYKNALSECFKHIRSEPDFNLLDSGIDNSKQTLLLAYVVAALMKQSSGDAEEAGHLLKKAYWHRRRMVGTTQQQEDWEGFVYNNQDRAVVEIAPSCVAMRYLDDLDQFTVNKGEERSVGIPTRMKMKMRSIYKVEKSGQEDLEVGAFVLLKTLILDAYLEDNPDVLNGLARDYCVDFARPN